MKHEIVKKTTTEYEKDEIFTKTTKGKIKFKEIPENELTEDEKIRKTGIKKNVTQDEYWPDPCECGTCMNYDDENDECQKNAEFFFHDPNEGGLKCDEYEYIYELEK